MFDGRIDTQGTVKDLREQGILEGIEHNTAFDAYKKQLAAEEATSAEEGIDVNVTKVAADDDMAPTKNLGDSSRTNIERPGDEAVDL